MNIHECEYRSTIRFINIRVSYKIRYEKRILNNWYRFLWITDWREWGNWQSCSRTCGGGMKERRRSCDGGAPNTGDCMGSDMEKEVCNDQSCTTSKIFLVVLIEAVWLSFCNITWDKSAVWNNQWCTHWLWLVLWPTFSGRQTITAVSNSNSPQLLPCSRQVLTK